MPRLHVFICVMSGAFSLAAVGRWGAVDLGRFFLFDRCLIVVLWLGLCVSPVFLYPLLVTCCCLQYIVSGSPFSPGYSNLLGFEFMRGSLCFCLAGLLVQAGLRILEVQGLVLGLFVTEYETQVFALVLCVQAAGYFQQALAKCALGNRWYSWMLENRLQCLLVNAYLRGWGAPWVRMHWVLWLARWMSRLRILLCSAVWVIEISWVLILADRRLALGILAATTVFHLTVWLLTGLAGYHYVVSHVLMMMLVMVTDFSVGIKLEYALAGGCCMLLSSIWVLLLRRRLFREYISKGTAGQWGRVADPADHLMSWWDGPYMRLYSYSVKTSSGQRFHFPVTRFSPYDTFLTDMHTHLMVLGRNWDLDPQLDADRARIRTGVWGLTVSIADRNRLYTWMDDPKVDLDILNLDQGVVKGADEYAISVTKKQNNNLASETLSSLIAFFQKLNLYQSNVWFRTLFLWPHFPGEDGVPDWSPLASECLPSYCGTDPVTEVSCYCIKTFYHGDVIKVVEERVFARFCID
jgi:hypothetical protein